MSSSELREGEGLELEAGGVGPGDWVVGSYKHTGGLFDP